MIQKIAAKNKLMEGREILTLECSSRKTNEERRCFTQYWPQWVLSPATWAPVAVAARRLRSALSDFFPSECWKK